jgi:dihydrofolate reductase
MAKMATGHVFCACSLDGFIARCDGDLDWLDKQSTDGEDHGYEAFMATVDGLVMGRHSYEKVLSFDCDWPYKKPVVVMSNHLKPEDIPAELRGSVSVTGESPREVMMRLAAEGWKRAYVDGGRLIQSFLREALIEDMHLSRMPILLGSGLPLFAQLNKDIDLEHLGTRTFDSGIVESRYRVLKTDVPGPSCAG